MLATCMLQQILHRQRNGQSCRLKMQPQTVFYPVDDDEAENIFNIGTEDYAGTWVYKNKKESSGENYGICVNIYPFSKQPEEAFI